MSSFGPASGPLSQPPAPVPPMLDSPSSTKRPAPIFPQQQSSPQSSPHSSLPLREPIVPWVTDFIVRHQKLILTLSLIPMFVAFNGRWRIGLDSSIYRGLARSLANGNGYHFGEFGSHQVYPGLPVLLAGLNKLFGENVFRPVAPILMLLAMSMAILAIVYQLIAKHYPKWMAICVTSGLAMNFWFVKVTHEVLTDIPFLLGLVMSLWSWDLFRAARSNGQRTRAATLMIAGLSLAAVMRPTFWILCLALLCVWTFGMIRGFFTGAWKFYAVSLALLLALCLAFIAVDPRGKDDSRAARGAWYMRLLSGGYESEMIEAIQEGKAPQTDSTNGGQSLRARLERNSKRLFNEHLMASFLGQELPSWAGTAFSLMLLSTSVLVFRKQPIWALLVVLSICVTLMLSTAPRYYVMVMPFLLLGYLLMVRKIGERFGGGWCEMVLLAGLMFAVCMNLAKIVPFVIEQHRTPITADHMRFYETYRRGNILPLIHLANLVREKVPPGARVIAPSAQIVRYLSDREVMMERELIPPRKSVKHYPEILAEKQIVYAAFPAKIYLDKEPMLASLMRHGVIMPGPKVGETNGIRLAQAKILVRPGDWQKMTPPTPKPKGAIKKPTTRKVKKPTTRSASAKASAAAKLRAEAKQRIEAKELKEAKERKLKREVEQRRAAAAAKAAKLKKKKKKAPTTTTIVQPPAPAQPRGP